MPSATILPDSDATTLDWTPKGGGTHYIEVDEGIAGTDDGTTEITAAAATAVKEDFYTMEDMPADFDAAIDFQCRSRAYQTGRVDDTVRWRPTIKESNETTTIGGPADDFAVTNTSYQTFEGSVRSNTDDKASWDTRKLRPAVLTASVGMPDSITLFCTVIEMLINYSSTGAHQRRGVTIGSANVMTF